MIKLDGPIYAYLRVDFLLGRGIDAYGSIGGGVNAFVFANRGVEASSCTGGDVDASRYGGRDTDAFGSEGGPAML